MTRLVPLLGVLVILLPDRSSKGLAGLLNYSFAGASFVLGPLGQKGGPRGNRRLHEEDVAFCHLGRKSADFRRVGLRRIAGIAQDHP